VIGALRSALGELARDGWVVGIAAAAALAYGAVTFVEAFAGFLLNLVDGQEVLPPELVGPGLEDVYDPPYSFELFGHYVLYEPLLRATLLLLVVVAVAAVALHATRTPAEAEPEG
jgi:hypothetical protein